MGEGGKKDVFGDVAVELGLLTPAQLQEGLEAKRAAGPAAASTPIGDFLIDKGLLAREQVHQILLEQNRRKVAKERRVGNYEIIEKIGVGGMGAVYRARDLRNGRVCALKILPPRFAKDEKYVKRFIHEAALASKILDHPNIVKGLGAGNASGFYYFVMELVEGENIHQMLTGVGCFPEETALKIMIPIAQALQHAHSHGLVHQDVKPENIIIDRKGTAKLLDLGLARRAGDVKSARVGTPLYVSPEQIRGGCAVDIRSDIYSLGVTLFHMVTGVPPFVGKTDSETLKQHLEEAVPWPQDVVPELSGDICLAISRMLTKEPDQRYASCEEVLYDFEAILNGQPVRFATEDPDAEAPALDDAEPESDYEHESPSESGRLPPVRGRSHRHRRPRRSAGRSSSTLMWAIAGGMFILVVIVVIVLKSG
jgi:serine/threonine-protein kinase